MSKQSIKKSQQRTKQKKHYFPCDQTEVSDGTVGKFCNKTPAGITILDSCTVKDYTFIQNNGMVLLNQDEVY